MKKIFLSVLILLITVAISHSLTLKFVPSVIMKKTMASMEQRGITYDKFTLAPKLTPQTQTVVRPSPDLAYSICLFDFRKSPHPLEIHAAAWGHYGSVSFFDAHTNNFATVRVEQTQGDQSGHQQGETIILTPPQTGDNEIVILDDQQSVAAPTQTGIVLIRRLAPTVELYGEVSALSEYDRCKTL